MDKKVMDDKWEKETSRDAIRDSFHTEDWERSFAVTLTMKPAIFSPFRELTLDSATQNFGDFLSLIDYHLLGETSQRDGKTPNAVSVVECSLGERLHYHALMACPVDVDESLFCDAIRQSWGETTWGDEVSIKPA